MTVTDMDRRRLLGALAAAVAAAPLLGDLARAEAAQARPAARGLDPTARQTLEAFADTVVPGRKRSADDLIIAGVTDGPGAVQAGAVDMMLLPSLGLAGLLGAPVALLNTNAVGYAARHGVRRTPGIAAFASLPFEHRTALLRELVAPDHVDRLIWVGLAFLSNLAFDMAAFKPTARAVADKHPGLEWMGFPAPDRDGNYRYDRYSYGRELADRHPASLGPGHPA